MSAIAVRLLGLRKPPGSAEALLAYMPSADDEIMAAKRDIDRMGIGCEPASAATLAGLRKLRAAGVIGPREQVVCVLTGHLLKDPDAVRGEVVEIDATLDAVERALRD